MPGKESGKFMPSRSIASIIEECALNDWQGLPSIMGRHESIEARLEVLDNYKCIRNVPISARDQVHWRAMITSFKAEADANIFETEIDELYNKAVSIYLSKSEFGLSLDALRFAIGLIDTEKHLDGNSQKQLIETILDWINCETECPLDLIDIFNQYYCREQDSPEFMTAKTLCLNGWLDSVPELKPIIETVLLKFQLYVDISETTDFESIGYFESDFNETKKTLRLLASQASSTKKCECFVDSLNALATVHRGMLRKCQRRAKENMHLVHGDIMTYVGSQAIINNTIQLLEKSSAKWGKYHQKSLNDWERMAETFSRR